MERLIKYLMEYGLSEKQAEVYLFIAKNGPCKASDVSKTLKMRRTEVYRVINELQSIGVIESTFDFPAKFMALPVSKALDCFIKFKQDEIIRLKELKEEICRIIDKVSIKRSSLPDRFMVIKNLKLLYLKILQMFKSARHTLRYIARDRDIAYMNYRGLFDALKNRKNIHTMILTEIIPRNLDMFRSISEKNENIKIKHVKESETLPQFIIKDEKEVIIYLNSKSSPGTSIGLWTNNSALRMILSNFFERLWVNSVAIKERIEEIKTGKPIYETYIVKDPELAYNKYKEITNSAEKEIIRITTIMGVYRILKNFPLKKLTNKGVKIYCIAPITEKNLDAALQLSKYCEIKHINLSCLRVIIVDDKHLFQLKTPESEIEDVIDPLTHFDNMLYSNDEVYVRNMRNFIWSVWSQAVEFEDRVRELKKQKGTVVDLKPIS
ncbi:MAG: TrmB family transcriptional regulator [Candidatus Odinarchaeia archaeon]